MDLSPDEENFQGRLLHQAALWDNLELLQELIVNGAEVDARDTHGRSALHAAALAERSACLSALCSAGAYVDARWDSSAGGKTALHIAAERGHVENIRAMLKAGASLHITDSGGDTALSLAEKNNHRHAARALREARDAQDRERLSQHTQLRDLVSRGESQQLKAKLATLGNDAGLIVNLTPGGANTLLYVAAEAGLTTAVAALLDAGADGRAHPVTKYSPLYIACYHGRLDIVKLLLSYFPEAVQQETVEKWLPLHAACIGGHASIVTLLLEYPYPASVLNTYIDPSGRWEYQAAFDINATDARGQSALYVASTLGNMPVLAALLDHMVPCRPIDKSEESEPPPASSPHRGGISLGIHAIVSRLTGGNQDTPSESSRRVRPVSLSATPGCDGSVVAAVRAGHVRALQRLLVAGASADVQASPPADLDADGVRDSRRSRSASASLARDGSPSPCRNNYPAERDGPWTALALAARASNIQIAEMLIAHGATDPHCRAIRECSRNGLVDLLAKLLATKAYADPDNKLNKSVIAEAVFKNKGTDAALTYSATCPTTPVAVCWRELKCQLARIRMSWLRSAALRVNPRLASDRAALLAITRVELTNNELRTLPPELFSLLSLRYLNVAQNKLERLPTSEDPLEDEMDSSGRRLKRKRHRPELYTAPALQELYLQDNRLEDLPPGLFKLPALMTLDVSNNKLRALPTEMWDAPSLRDINAALNHLRDLPTGRENQSESPGLPPTSPLESPLTSASPSNSTSPFNFTSSSYLSRSPSSPSIDRSDSEDEGIPIIGNRSGNAVCTEARRVHAWRGAVQAGVTSLEGSPLAALNLSHNQFTCLPPALACRAHNLKRLNMSYNSLRSMSYVTSYPTSLRQLDLSHNKITCWPSLPQVENFGTSDDDPLACYCKTPQGGRSRPRSGGSVRSQLLNAACLARRHLRLEGLRTLILANNQLNRIQLTTDGDGCTANAPDDSNTDDTDDWNTTSSLKGRLLFPLLSMLDVSCNMLKSVPPAIHELTNLSVLNISGNKGITELPPQMGLLSRLWNLNTVGCSLGEPLLSMLRGGNYKSMDIVGYLKSVLQEARPYSSMKLMLVGLQGIGKTSLLECLRQESGLQHRRKPAEHWAKRMGNKSSRGNVSTVGVDIGTWVYEKHRSTRGPITFRTWDFGGQQEYYATHQYFLSRRSLYLVVWKVTEGKRGLAGALNWLRSIQARAPGSPVIMVATHYDQVANSNLPESESPEVLQRLIRSSIMGAPDADKLGLPRVMDSVEISCSTRHNIRLLADIIYSVAFSVKPPGSKEPLLEQKIPATYLALEECVTSLAAELREPVLSHDEYRRLVTQYMQQKNHRMFRDAAELHQATMFLHENGVLLHYDDASLKQLYFLKPQWLCDVLSHVVTIREINPFANNGIMKIEDLAHVFKASPMLARGEEASSLGVSLLNKFELALCWDSRVLLVPPLLPNAEPASPQLALRSKTWSHSSRNTPRRAFPASVQPHLTLPEQSRPTDSPVLIQDHTGSITVSGRGGEMSLVRLVLLSYVPSGFWARLTTRVLADAALAVAAGQLYRLTPEMEVDEGISRALEGCWGWKLWKTGLSLCCGALTVASLRDLPARTDALLGLCDDGHTEHAYTGLRLRVRQEGAWCDLEVDATACVELCLPAQVCVVKRDDGLPIAGYQSISLEPNPETLAKLLALLSDHVDLLLEDWYPSLGTRFVHTSEGRCLITRLVPCPACLKDAGRSSHDDMPLAQAFRRFELGALEPRRARLSQDSRASDGDSGVGAESNASSRLGSVEGIVNEPRPATSVYAWTVEDCILAACTSTKLQCALHSHVELRQLAPDALLLDVEEEKRARWEQITRGVVAGRGAFGTVLTGTWRRSPANLVPVAIKALQPVPPPSHHDVPAQQAYKAALSRWDRDPLSAACRAYCGLRQELGIVLRLSHPHVVSLRAVCAAPLALLLELAPQGALDAALREYRSGGARVGERAARAVLLQVARALEYLHARRIVYRDLKSENVLVWHLPKPHEAAEAEINSAPLQVLVKLGDYGISRLAPPSGTKGFGGTEGFMAPEIMRYNGEEEYNEKVDCFSYGMLIYEVVTCRQPFEGHEAVKEAVLEGVRPTLTPRELEYPCCVLEMMRRCWSGSPEARPSGAALVSLSAAPEYGTLRDAAACRPAATAAALPLHTQEGALQWELWYGGGEPERVHTLLASPHAFTHHHTVRLLADKAEPVVATAVCVVGATVWVGDSSGRLTVYSASTCALKWCAKVQDSVGGASSGIVAMLSLADLGRVALALACGRLFLVTGQEPVAEGCFVLSELGAARELCCLAAVPTPHGFEVWAGGDSLSAYRVSAEGVCGAEAVAAGGRVALLAAAAALPCVYAYTQPGVSVYQYSVVTKKVGCRLDCSKLVPCSESLQSISLDEHFDQCLCRVTALSAVGDEVYVGTAWGCVIVADAATLRPITVCRPYEQDVTAIIPLPQPKKSKRSPMLATFGNGYRPLVQRYAPTQTNNAQQQYNGYYCLLWNSRHWLPD
ncbi:leucine-rich repeat serine/threonine-protein kinase 1 isoform X2 [Bombyx mori]|uniref:non-specific serine/threonine protein kinase n=1 Tax=Bombyx mori TaxID=7091 RepID=A0A8R2M8B3_BOMMO|nr:leucine-rich repeat serine/threonine-protein kinase 1 isoform X2 [Bombyx mori]